MQAGRQAGIARCVYRTVPSVFLIDWHARTHARMHASIVAEQFDRQPIEVGSVFGFAPKQFEGVESFCFERHRFALDGPDAPSKGGGEFKLVVVDIVVLLVSVGVVLAIDQKQSGTAGIQDPTVGVPERYLVDSGKRNVDPEGNASIGSTSTSTTSGTFALPRRKHRMVVLVTVTVTDYAYTAAAAATATAAVVLEDPVLFRVEGIFSVQRQRQRRSGTTTTTSATTKGTAVAVPNVLKVDVPDPTKVIGFGLDPRRVVKFGVLGLYDLKQTVLVADRTIYGAVVVGNNRCDGRLGRRWRRSWFGSGNHYRSSGR
mmetsp:Transcript_15578/g.33671  ORF Transcript_15578/g.33671 Transcript_15578/m.33671 type:complete len:315 (+) Transcript_15578:828-1772(+)